MLVSSQEGLPLATHLPLELVEKDGKLFLHGHVAAANAQKSAIYAGQRVLTVFTAAHSYISPSWYGHQNVPTWNYRAVHCYGILREMRGEELHDALRKLTARYEATVAEPMYFDSLPKSYVESHIRALVGFEIAVDDMQAAAKLSQNRTDESYRNIIVELRKRGDADSLAIAHEMERLRK